MSSIRLQIKDSIMHYLCDDWNNHKRGKAHKENIPLYDREKGYANWNEIDLEMVMEKVIKGIYATDFNEYEKQIRADAIDEFLRRIHSLERYKIVSENGRMDSLYYDYDITKIAEQLKENKNEMP